MLSTCSAVVTTIPFLKFDATFPLPESLTTNQANSQNPTWRKRITKRISTKYLVPVSSPLENVLQVPPLTQARPSATVTAEEREEWLSHLTGVAVSSDAFVSHQICRNPDWINDANPCCCKFPFIDNVLRTSRSGVKYIACPTGSQADQDVFATCEKLGITFVEQSVRLVCLASNHPLQTHH